MSAFAGGADEEQQLQWAVGESLRSLEEHEAPGSASTSSGKKRARSPAFHESSISGLLSAAAGIIDEGDLEHQDWLRAQGFLEDWDTDYGLLSPSDQVIIRPYGGDDDDIMLQELRPRFVVMYEPNLAFIRRLEVGAELWRRADPAGVQELQPRPRAARVPDDIQQLVRGGPLPRYNVARV